MQSVPINTKIVSSNSEFVSDLPRLAVFFGSSGFPTTSLHNISEMLLKVALNTTDFVFHYQTDWKGRISSVSKIKNKRLFATEYICHRWQHEDRKRRMSLVSISSMLKLKILSYIAEKRKYNVGLKPNLTY